MENLNEWLDHVKSVSGIVSDSQLNLALGITGTNVLQWRRARSMPSEANMLKLAALANYDPAEALLLLNQWRAKDPSSRDIYRQISEKLRATAALLLLAILIPMGAGTKSVQAAPTLAPDIHYATRRRLFFILH